MGWFRSTFSLGGGGDDSAGGSPAGEAFHSIFASLLGVDGTLATAAGTYHTIETSEQGAYLCTETRVDPPGMVAALDLSSALPGPCADDHTLHGRWEERGAVAFEVENAFYELDLARRGHRRGGLKA